MNSTAKGNKLELAAFSIFQRLVAEGQWGLPEYCKIRRKPRYYSKERESEIEFDISIEISRPGAATYSLLVLIECKNCERKISVDDAEELEGKRRQVAGSKAIIVSAQGFQEGTMTFAKSNRMGLARYFEDSSLQWILDRTPSIFGVPQGFRQDPTEIREGLLSQEHRGRYSDYYCYAEGVYTTSLGVFLENLLGPVAGDDPALAKVTAARAGARSTVEYLPNEEIESVVEGILRRVGYAEGEVPLDAICEWQSKEAGLKVMMGVTPGAQEVNAGVTGRLSANPLEIKVFSRSNSHPARLRFTLAHELGHHFLGHLKHLAAEACGEADIETDLNLEVGANDIQRMEWQANYFASCLLLPKGALVRDFLELAREHDLRDRGFGMLYVDGERWNQRPYNAITGALMLKYTVSKTVVTLRLQKLGYLNDSRRLLTSLGNAIRRPGGR